MQRERPLTRLFFRKQVEDWKWSVGVFGHAVVVRGPETWSGQDLSDELMKARLLTFLWLGKKILVQIPQLFHNGQYFEVVERESESWWRVRDFGVGAKNAL